MYVFVVGMERCGTHSSVNIIKSACQCSYFIVHEQEPFLCKEAKLLFEGKDFRTDDLKKKVSTWRKHHKTCELVCEANHRLGYFITFLSRQFPGCKIIFLYRDPFATIISRLCIWSYYPEYMLLYPDFYKKRLHQIKSHDFNDYRITPPNSFSIRSIIDLYMWEWVENYKFSRNELACIPKENRLIMMTESLTTETDKLFGFIGKDYFKIDDEVIRCANVKGDSVYATRDPTEDQTIMFAKQEVSSYKGVICNYISSELNRLQVDLDDDIINMDRKIMQFLKIKM